MHPGGPFWAKKDIGAWSIPKGEFGDGEDPLTAARREFVEETGLDVDGVFIELLPLKQAGGKVVHAWAIEGDCDAAALSSNTFSMEWPPGSGTSHEYPEVDRASWFGIPEARRRLLEGQTAFLEELLAQLGLGAQSS